MTVSSGAQMKQCAGHETEEKKFIPGLFGLEKPG